MVKNNKPAPEQPSTDTLARSNNLPSAIDVAQAVRSSTAAAQKQGSTKRPTEPTKPRTSQSNSTSAMAINNTRLCDIPIKGS